jgi:hypothetical protein
MGKMMDVPLSYGSSEIQIGTADLPGGYYLLEVTDNENGKMEVYKFVKED